MKTRALTTLGFILLVSLSGIAGDNPRSVNAVRVAVPPKIDGLLDDEVWKLAVPAADFLQREPEEGMPASESSEVRVLYDDDALYFGCIYFDLEPDKIVARLTRRDDEIESDQASIRIDAYHDHQTGYEFTFNAAGVKTDILQYDDANQEDASWDAVWELETRILPNGWAAELRIPFRILRYRTDAIDSAGSEWGINFLRYISRKKESDRWAFTPKSESGFISRFGHLRGLSNLPNPRQLEVLPFVVGKERFEPTRPFQDREHKFLGDVGLDLKYSLSNSFTLDATINPDFGQVEADPAVLNLTTFETFYPEKRPFFIEGTQILRFTTFGGDFGPGMFYSRRIGRAISPDEVDVPTHGKIIDLPQATTILGAAKINGKTKGGLSVGILQAFTQEEQATVADASGMQYWQILEPSAHYNVIRLKQDVLGNSNVGMILTSVVREKRSPAMTNGFDWNLKLGQNAYAVAGFFAHSHTENGVGDRIHGSAGRMNVSRIAAEHWLWSLDGRYVSKRYNINDVGFFFRPDGYTGTGTITYKEDAPSAVVRDYSVSFKLTEFRNLAGVSLQRELRLDSRILFLNYWQMTTNLSGDFGLYDDRETRGNGLYRRPVGYVAGISLSTDSRNDLVGETGQQVAWDHKRKFLWASEAEVTLRPASWMEYQLEGQYRIVRNQEAWTHFWSSAGGNLFADRSTDEVNLTMRGTVTFTRELTLQLYGQVFLAKGHYGNYRLLVGTSDFVPLFVLAEDDFNTQSLNTNIVLRWEYLPGSTMYLVWSQARSGDNRNYFSSFGSDLGDTFNVPASNVVLLKVSYLMSL